MKRVLHLALAGILTTGLLVGCGQKEAPKKEEAQKAWVPEKEINFLVPSSAGGGSDLNARTISDIAFKNKLVPKSFMVENKGGGSGAVAYSEEFAKKGDPHSIMVYQSGQVIGSYVNNWDVKADMLTPIATVALDELTLGVKSDSKYKDIDSLLKAIKENPESIKIGGAQRGNGDHLVFELVNKYTNSKFNYVSFNGAGDVMSALLGGHVDVGIFNPIECIGQVEAGKVIPIVTFSEKRISGAFKDAPTFVEKGYKDIQIAEYRAIAGPPDMPAEAVKFYEDMLKKVTETEEWKKNYIEKNYLTNHYLNAEDTKKFTSSETEKYVKIFKEVGVMK